jgi:hypothetical protein
MKTLTKAILITAAVALLTACGEDADERAQGPGAGGTGQTSPMTTGDRDQTAAPGAGPMEGRTQSTLPGGPTTEPPGQAMPGPRIDAQQQ